MGQGKHLSGTTTQQRNRLAKKNPNTLAEKKRIKELAKKQAEERSRKQIDDTRANIRHLERRLSELKQSPESSPEEIRKIEAARKESLARLWCSVRMHCADHATCAVCLSQNHQCVGPRDVVVRGIPKKVQREKPLWICVKCSECLECPRHDDECYDGIAEHDGCATHNRKWRINCSTLGRGY